jgi:hypothetical protein
LTNNDVVNAFPNHAAMIVHAVHAGMHQTANSDVGTRHGKPGAGSYRVLMDNSPQKCYIMGNRT